VNRYFHHVSRLTRTSLEAAELLAKMHRQLSVLRGWSIVVKNMKLKKYAEYVERKVDDELKQGSCSRSGQ